VSKELNAVYAAQVRGVALLTDLLMKAGKEGLPVAAWWLTSKGNLSAHCVGATDLERRASFEAWADLLGAKRLPDQIAPLWTVELRARTETIYGRQVDLVSWLDESFGGETE
jgi:hypothetical protein